MSTPILLESGAEAVREVWARRLAEGQLNDRSVTLYGRHLDTFVRYMAACGVTDTSELDLRLVNGWVDAPISAVSPGSRGRAGQAPSPSTRRNRQVSIRSVLGEWADRGWVDPEVVPTRVIERTPSLAPCPLTPRETARLRLAGQQSPADTLLPALVALGLAGANHTEIARLTLDSYDTGAGSVRVVGRGGRVTRTVPLGAAARRAVDAHVRALRRVKRLRDLTTDTARCPLALPTAPRTHRLDVTPTAVGQHLYRALDVAGITRSGVTPGSLQEYAANVCYARTNRVEDVAALLGLVSLDAAMRLIHHGWQTEHAATIREQQD